MNIRCLVLLSSGLLLGACHSTHDEDYDQQPHPTTTQPQGSTSKSSSSTANASWSAAASADDKDFVAQAAQGGAFEVKSSELALTKGVSPEMRSFAQMMVDDHGKANKELSDLARKHGITASTMLDTKHQTQLDGLAALDGDAFEHAYREAQIKAHDGAIELFEKAAKECDAPELKSFAQRTLPTLRAHRSQLGS